MVVGWRVLWNSALVDLSLASLVSEWLLKMAVDEMAVDREREEVE